LHDNRWKKGIATVPGPLLPPKLFSKLSIKLNLFFLHLGLVFPNEAGGSFEKHLQASKGKI